jgi:hypothetical protein
MGGFGYFSHLSFLVIKILFLKAIEKIKQSYGKSTMALTAQILFHWGNHFTFIYLNFTT